MSGKRENFVDWWDRIEIGAVAEKGTFASRNAIRGRFFRLMDGPEVF